jgi:hypothetical protein
MSHLHFETSRERRLVASSESNAGVLQVPGLPPDSIVHEVRQRRGTVSAYSFSVLLAIGESASRPEIINQSFRSGWLPETRLVMRCRKF